MKAVVFLALILLGGGCRSIKKPAGPPDYVVRMEVTGYCDCQQCTGWKRSFWKLGAPVYASGPQKGKRKKVGQTASGTQARKGTIAADTRHLPMGTRLYVPGYGMGIVEDRGGAIKGKRLDLFFPSHKEALEWGRQWVDVQIWR